MAASTLQVKRGQTKTELDGLRNERVRNIIAGDHIDVAYDKLDDTDAYKWDWDRDRESKRTIFDLIGHVTFDGDGGVMNLHSTNNRHSNSKHQHSKVEKLTKKWFPCTVASFRFVMIVLNSSGILFLTFRVLHRYYYNIDGPEAQLAVNKSLPLPEMIVGVKLVEALFVLWIILRVLWHVFCICCFSDDLLPDIQETSPSRVRKRSISSAHSHDTVGSQEIVDTSVKVYALPKFKRLSAIFWMLLPRLQGFSALQIFQFAYPGLVVKTKDMFTWRQLSARLVAEKFLKVGENTISDQELSEHVLRHILLLRYGPNLSEHKEECEVFLEEHGETDITSLTWMLMAAGSKQGTQVSDEVDWKALDCHCRIRLVSIAEDVCKFGFMILCFVAGYVTLFTKLCIFTSLIAMDNPCPYTISGYSALFLNQAINILDVNMWLMWRVTTFLFGGTDARVSAEEAFIMQTYKAILCERVWDSSMSFIERLAIMMTLDDDDLQRLVVEEDPGRKGELLLNLRRYKRSIKQPLGDKILQCCLGVRSHDQIQSHKAKKSNSYSLMESRSPRGQRLG